MKTQDASSSIKEHRERLTRLLNSISQTVRDVAFDLPTEFDVEGVYIISTPDDKEMVYTGRTKTKSVTGRVQDHRRINTGSDLKGMLKTHKSYPQETDDYKVRCIEIIDPRERTFFEYFVIGVLKPAFNK